MQLHVTVNLRHLSLHIEHCQLILFLLPASAHCQVPAQDQMQDVIVSEGVMVQARLLIAPMTGNNQIALYCDVCILA